MRRCRAARALLIALALAAPPAQLPAAQAQAPTPPATLPPARSEPVQLDVAVADASGRPVADLAAASFQVTEDGRPQTISQFAVESRFAARPSGRSGSRSTRTRCTA